MMASRFCVPAILSALILSHAIASFADDEKQAEPPEIHAVAIYTAVVETDGKIHGPRAEIRIDRPGKEVILVVSSQEPVTWHIDASEGTTFKNILLCGIGPQAVEGLPKEAPVEKQWHEYGEDAAGETLPAVYHSNSTTFRAYVAMLTKWFKGSRLSSFHGAYRPERAFVIDAVQDNPQLANDYPQPAPVNEWPDVADMLHFDTHHRDGKSIFFGEHTMFGPVTERLQPLPEGISKIAFDPKRKAFFGFDSQRVYRVDLEKGAIERLEVGLDVPPLSGMRDIAFDTKRDRLIVGTASGGGYLYSYSPETNAWSVIGKHPAVDSFSYSAEHDCLYGLSLDYAEEGSSASIAKVNLEGAIVSKVPLLPPITSGIFSYGGSNCYSLVPRGDYLAIVMLQTDEPARFERVEKRDNFIYLADLRTGEVWLTYRSSANTP